VKEAGGIHMASHGRRLVLVLTDTMGSQALAQALMEGDSSVVQISTQELSLYRQFDRFALVRNPVQRLAKAYRHHADELLAGDSAVGSFEDFTKEMCRKIAHGLQPKDVTATWFSYVLSQFGYMQRGTDCEVDGLFDLAQANVWLPYLQRRYGLADIRLDDSIGQNSGPLSTPTLSIIQKTYAQDYAILSELKDAPFVVL
jgi:hypothetical protein